MTHDTSHDIKVLNHLIETTIDSSEGYAEAAKDSESAHFSSSFQGWSQDRLRVSEMLKAQVAALGGKPEDSGTTLASAHRLFVNLRKTLSSGDVAVVDEVERGEDHIKHKYEDALKDTALSASTRQVIDRAFSSVKTGHDQARDLKHSLHANT
jgi:uncharacterized protein (TIGR02284 family)